MVQEYQLTNHMIISDFPNNQDISSSIVAMNDEDDQDGSIANIISNANGNDVATGNTVGSSVGSGVGTTYGADSALNNGSSSGGSNNNNETIELRGYLNKWTNYIYGWQSRYIVLRGGTLSYYKSETESDLGCRGAISLSKAKIKSHESDELRFDVIVNNYNSWCLRADTPEDRTHWVEVLQLYKEKSLNKEKETAAPTTTTSVSTTTTPTSGTSLCRHDSTISLQSNTVSLTSDTSLNKAHHTLKEKVGEIETFKDILFGQIEKLQKYFDECENLNETPISTNSITTTLTATTTTSTTTTTAGDVLKPIDFKGESITFRATTTGVLMTLQHCLELIEECEEMWKKKLDREIEKRKKVEEINKKYKEQIEKRLTYPGPDLEEGPNSTLLEDEFFDAVETGLEKIEEDMQIRAKLKLQSQQSQTLVNVPHQATTTTDLIDGHDGFGTGKSAQNHILWPEIDRVCNDQLRHAREGVGHDGNGWQIFADEGEIKMYKREEEVNGLVMDPLKAYHSVDGVTAREMCHYFFMPEFRNDWETTLEDCTILEKISADTLVFLQTHKRIWPASQRDALFWSHMRKITDGLDKDAVDTWIVCNNSTDYSTQAVNKNPKNGRCVRIFLTVILVCQTFLPNGIAITDENLARKDLTCKITYCSVVNPGGWAPASALRAVYKREYPKFLKRFTSYVIDQCKDKPIMF